MRTLKGRGPNRAQALGFTELWHHSYCAPESLLEQPPLPQNVQSIGTTAKLCTAIKALSHYKHPLLPARQDGCLQTHSYLDVLSRFSFSPSYFKGFSNMSRQKKIRETNPLSLPFTLSDSFWGGFSSSSVQTLSTESSGTITTIRALKTRILLQISF